MSNDNPYQAPAAPVSWGGHEEEGDPQPSANVDGPVQEAELRYFIGPGARRYIRRWSSLRGTRRAGILGFHWGAFLILGLWLPYRKMYRATALCYLFVTSAGVLDYELPHQFPHLFREGMVFWPTILALPFVGGLWGYLWYLQSACRRILAIRSSSHGLPDDTYRNRLIRRGGTSILAPWISLLVFGLSLVLLGIVIDLIHGFA